MISLRRHVEGRLEGPVEESRVELPREGKFFIPAKLIISAIE